MSLCSMILFSVMMGFPRVSGDEPDPVQVLRDAITFSPRERG